MLSLDFVGFAEAAAIDPRGNVTASGLMPQFYSLDSFPGQIAPWFIVVAEGDGDGYDDESILVELKVNGPEDETLFFVQQTQPTSRNLYQGFPTRFVLAAQVPFAVAKPGIYEFKLTVKSQSSEEVLLEAPRTLRLIDSSQLKLNS